MSVSQQDGTPTQFAGCSSWRLLEIALRLAVHIATAGSGRERVALGSMLVEVLVEFDRRQRADGPPGRSGMAT